MYLGIKVVAALAIERIHRANLVNFGIVPLLFANAEDYEKIAEGDTLKIENVPAQLAVGAPVFGKLIKADGSEFAVEFKHQLSDEDIAIIKAGGRLNC